MKNPAFDFCCSGCGHLQRYPAQLRRYRQIVHAEVEASDLEMATGLRLAPMRQPAWKSLRFPRATGNLVQGASLLGELTPRDLRLRHKQLDVRRRRALLRKRQRQDGLLPYSV